VVVEFEYGLDRPPADLVRQAYVRLRTVLNINKQGVPDRASSFTMTDGGTFRLDMPGAFKTGVPSRRRRLRPLLPALHRHRRDRPGRAGLADADLRAAARIDVPRQAAVSVAASAKAYLVGKDGALKPLLPGVQVAYSRRGHEARARLRRPRSRPGRAEGVRRRRPGEAVRGPDAALHIRSTSRTTRETTEARAVEIGDVIAELHRRELDPRRPDGAEEGRRSSGVELDGWTDDDGSGSILTHRGRPDDLLT
jgi:hypothetical protein